MNKKAILTQAVLSFLLCIGAAPLKAAEPERSSGTAADTSLESSKISLVEMAPEIYYQFRRYPKFYGDENTKHGDLLERSFLFDNMGGARDDLVDQGIYFDAAVTQFFQGNSSGGADAGSARYNGSADYWLTLDTGKAGLWPGGAIFAHAESTWRGRKTINGDTGSLLPANFDAAMPAPGESTPIALSELYLVQGLPNNFLFLAGKVNFSGLADTSYFANNERAQFQYTGLVNNPILGAFVPYTSLGAGLVWAAPSKKHTVALIGLQSKGNGTTAGFDNFNGEYTLGGQYQYSTMMGGNLPGDYRMIAGYSNKDVTNFDIDPRHLISEIIGAVPVAQKSDNYAFLLNFDQYLWVRDARPDAGRKHLPPVGIGLFGRAGWSPQDRNVISQFYSAGIGGYGMVIPGRDNDQWGIGWSGTYISGDLRDDLDVLSINLDTMEHAGEAFYNFELTPASHLTVNAQVIDSTLASTDTAYVIGARLQVDF